MFTAEQMPPSFWCEVCRESFRTARLLRRHCYFNHRGVTAPALLNARSSTADPSPALPPSTGNAVPPLTTTSSAETNSGGLDRAIPALPAPSTPELNSPAVQVDFSPDAALGEFLISPPFAVSPASFGAEWEPRSPQLVVTTADASTQVSPPSQRTTGVQTTEADDTRPPLDYLLLRPRRLRARRRIIPRLEHDRLSIRRPPQFLLPSTLDLVPAFSEQVECVTAMSLKDPIADLRCCDCQRCVHHALVARREKYGAGRPENSCSPTRELKFVPLPAIDAPKASDRAMENLTWINRYGMEVLCSCRECIGHRLLLLAWRQARSSQEGQPPAAGGCRGRRDRRD